MLVVVGICRMTFRAFGAAGFLEILHWQRSTFVTVCRIEQRLTILAILFTSFFPRLLSLLLIYLGFLFTSQLIIKPRPFTHLVPLVTLWVYSLDEAPWPEGDDCDSPLFCVLSTSRSGTASENTRNEKATWL